MARASVRSNLFTENLATISLHLRWQGGKQQTTLGTKYGFRSKLNFISYQRSKSREPNLSQRSKNKATTVTEWPLCRQDTSMKSIYSPFPIFSILAKLEMANLQMWKHSYMQGRNCWVNARSTALWLSGHCADKTPRWRVSILPSPFFLYLQNLKLSNWLFGISHHSIMDSSSHEIFYKFFAPQCFYSLDFPTQNHQHWLFTLEFTTSRGSPLTIYLIVICLYANIPT